MTEPWTSSTGLMIRDLVPASLRRHWVAQGRCPGRDLYTLFSEHVRAHPQRQAVIDAEGCLDYAGLDSQVRRIAGTLAASGLGPHDIVGIRVPNGRAAVAAELGVAALGAVALPYPSGRGWRDTVNLLGRSRATAAIFADPADADCSAELPHLRTVFTGFDDAVDTGWTPQPVDPEAPARILVTSGSEATPKMIAYSHNAMAGGRATYVRALHSGDDPMRVLLLAPLASSYGSCGTFVTIAALGGTLVLQRSFDAAAALRAIGEHRPTHVFAVPAMLRRMVDQPGQPGEGMSKLQAVVSSSAELPDSLVESCRERFGCDVISVYGSADGVNCHTARTGISPGTGTGLPDSDVAEIRIVKSTGDDAAPGEVGEICARGPMTPLCYVGTPDLDAKYRTSDGWVRTGDRGRFDDRGRLHLLGRLKQIVVRGGYNISPTEVERHLATHPAVSEAACVGVPDPDLGERLCACVSQRRDSTELALRDVTAFLEEQRGLERRKLPELLVVLPELPLAPTGKVCRRTLTDIAVSRAKPSTVEVRPASVPSGRYGAV